MRKNKTKSMSSSPSPTSQQQNMKTKKRKERDDKTSSPAAAAEEEDISFATTPPSSPHPHSASSSPSTSPAKKQRRVDAGSSSSSTPKSTLHNTTRVRSASSLGKEQEGVDKDGRTQSRKKKKKQNPNNNTNNKKEEKEEVEEEEDEEKEEKSFRAAWTNEGYEEGGEASLSLLTPLEEEKSVEKGKEKKSRGTGLPTTTPAIRDFSSPVFLLQRSKVIAPDCSGIRALAVHPDESNFVVARENGSFMKVEVNYFQNMPHFTVVRHTGGRRRRTVTSMHYWALPDSMTTAVVFPLSSSSSSVSSSRDGNSNPSSSSVMTAGGGGGGGKPNSSRPSISLSRARKALLLVTYLSGQVVVYDSDTLFPIHVHQRTGGALWGSSWISSSSNPGAGTPPSPPPQVGGGEGGESEGSNGGRLLTAVADGSWQQWHIFLSPSSSSSPSSMQRTYGIQVVLERIIPRVVGSARALSVHGHPTALVAAGTNDGGQVVAWRFSCADPRVGGGGRGGAHRSGGHLQSSRRTEEVEEGGGTSSGGNASTGHILWVSQLPKGVGLCCCVCMGGGVGVPVVVVGSTSGEVVLLDIWNGGHPHAVFSHHRGPVSSIIASLNERSFFVTGWHEALRCYRCDTHPKQGERGTSAISSSSSSPDVLTSWAPAEVKRRTHYHEATQLALFPQRQLFLSASRDGTVLYSPLHELFTSPANYLPLTTQQMTYCRRRNMWLCSRYGRMEVFQPDTACRHWRPVLAYASHGRFHLSGLWCDSKMRTVVYSTDERVVVLRMRWKTMKTSFWSRSHSHGASFSSAGLLDEEEGEGEERIKDDEEDDTGEVRRVEEVCQLPAKSGLLDVVFVDLEEEKEREEGGTPPGRRRIRSSSSSQSHGAETKKSEQTQVVYLLYDNGIMSVTARKAANGVHNRRTSRQNNKMKEAEEEEEVVEKEGIKLQWTSFLTSMSSSLSNGATDAAVSMEEANRLRLGGNWGAAPVRKLFWCKEEAARGSKKKSKSNNNDSCYISSSLHFLVACGPEGSWKMQIDPEDGTILSTSLRFYRHQKYNLPHRLPMIGVPSSFSTLSSGGATANREDSPGSSFCSCMAALSLTDNRYVCGSALFSAECSEEKVEEEEEKDKKQKRTSSPVEKSEKKQKGRKSAGLTCGVCPRRVFLPSTLPQDTVFVAQVHPASFHLFASFFPSFASSSSAGTGIGYDHSSEVLLIGYFRRGVLLSTTRQWKMIYRGSIEDAFIMPGEGEIGNDRHHHRETRAAYGGGGEGGVPPRQQHLHREGLPASESEEEEEEEGSTHRTLSGGKCEVHRDFPNDDNDKDPGEIFLKGRLLIVERNLEKALESLPLTWKVRRFGN